MRFNEALFIILIPVIFAKCNSGSSAITKSFDVSSEYLDANYPKEDKMILMSCIRCGCFPESLNKMNKEHLDYLSQFTFITDTGCNKLKIPVNHLGQKDFDIISEKIYNLALVKRENGSYKARIIETEEAKDLIKIAKQFFNR